MINQLIESQTLTNYEGNYSLC